MVDDIRVFHHVADPLELPSSRFFGMAERLHLRGGAVAHTFALALGPTGDDRAPTVVAPPPALAAAPLPDISELVGISGPNSQGHPWIEYRGG